MIVAILLFFFKPKSCKVAYDSQIYYKSGNIIYNSVDGDICSINIELDTPKIIIKNRNLISAYDYILCKDNGVTEIVNYSGESIDLKLDIDIIYGEVHNDYIYYIERHLNKIPTLCKMNILTNEKTEFPHIKTLAFHIEDDKIYYEFDNSIFEYNSSNLTTKKIYTGQYCYFFSIEDGKVFLSNYTNDNKLLLIDNNIYKELNIKSTQFCVYENTLYYIEHIFEYNQDVWKKRKNKGVTIYETDIARACN